MTINKPLQTVVVKTCGSQCNLNCSYCFYLNKELKYSEEKVMDDETLNIFIKQMMEETGNSFGIVWQGGEPSLGGAAFFRKAISLMQLYGEGKNKNISNLLQTNGYFLSEELITILSDYSFLCGLSLDGPQDIHNTFRKTISGKGSWKQVMNSYEKLQKKNIATNILCCVTSVSANQAVNIYNFFKQQQMLWLQFIPVTEYNHDNELSDFSVSPEAWGKFMCSIFDLWHIDFITNNMPPIIRFIENAFHSHIGISATECTFSEECGNYLVLEHNGDVFSCDYLVGKDTKLGNIHQKKLIEMLNSSQQNAFGKAKKNHHVDCSTCHWLNYCYGGCPKYRNIDSQKSYFCESWKMFLNYSESRFIPIVETYLRNNPSINKQTLDISGYF
ncbi:MAG: anaerobic sulfatase maturase [Bacteroidales bacterium]